MVPDCPRDESAQIVAHLPNVGGLIFLGAMQLNESKDTILRGPLTLLLTTFQRDQARISLINLEPQKEVPSQHDSFGGYCLDFSRQFSS